VSILVSFLKAVALSRDNFIWLYDPANVKLVKIDEKGNVILSSNELYEYVISADGDLEIFVFEDQLYLYDHENLKQFDEYGSWVKTFPFTSNCMQFGGSEILFLEDKTLKSYNTEVQFREPVRNYKSVPAGVVDFYVENGKVYCIDAYGYFVL